jgi:hypothetical protein
MPDELVKPFLLQAKRTRQESFRLSVLGALFIQAYFRFKRQ